MLNMITAARYPIPAGSQPQEPMVVVARSIIDTLPLHRRTASTASSSSSATSSASASSFVSDEKAALLPASVKKASDAIRTYGSMLKHHRSESRTAELKRSISRPINHDGQCFCEAGQLNATQEKPKQKELESSLGSVYSSRTWASQMEGELSRIGDAFEYDDLSCTAPTACRDRRSIQTFSSSERSYTFF
ncbi:hypothetical protein PHBOTO_003575 [Pseudozyma hubeiensis]|nr:hypothetical protein PHBOTO_003575 [Pseudozyma hubeiensis]